MKEIKERVEHIESYLNRLYPQQNFGAGIEGQFKPVEEKKTKTLSDKIRKSDTLPFIWVEVNDVREHIKEYRVEFLNKIVNTVKDVEVQRELLESETDIVNRRFGEGLLK